MRRLADKVAHGPRFWMFRAAKRGARLVSRAESISFWLGRQASESGCTQVNTLGENCMP
jgi:hypothetical protein